MLEDQAGRFRAERDQQDRGFLAIVQGLGT
jgi:hypothetical protein